MFIAGSIPMSSSSALLLHHAEVSVKLRHECRRSESIGMKSTHHTSESIFTHGSRFTAGLKDDAWA
jgi:hypothetical protein